MLIKKLLITFWVMALVVGCSNEQPTESVKLDDLNSTYQHSLPIDSSWMDARAPQLAAASVYNAYPYG